jgi:hypothetical protein
MHGATVKISAEIYIEKIGLCTVPAEQQPAAVSVYIVVCLFSCRYNPLWLYFPQPGSGL